MLSVKIKIKKFLHLFFLFINTRKCTIDYNYKISRNSRMHLFLSIYPSRRPSSTSVQMLVNSINASVRPIKADGGRADGKADTDPEVIDNASKFVQVIHFNANANLRILLSIK